MTQTLKSRDWWLFYAALLSVVAAAYYPAWHGGLLWDDVAHMTKPALQSWQGLARIWTELGAAQQYYPLAHSAFWLQHLLWGDDVLGYHLVNILLHATSAFLVALILYRLAVPGAFLAAAIFALHPVGVESVAWISELKNALSTAFYLAAALAYLRFDEDRDRRYYVVALLLFIGALLTKTVTATLPAALLIAFWWRRGRLRLRDDVVPLTPFFILGIAGGLLTAWVERRFIGAQGAGFDLTLAQRALVAGRATWFYSSKLVWPTHLSFVYPRWNVRASEWWQWLFPVALWALLAVCWWLRRRTRSPLAVLLLYSVGLFPALGFIAVYPFRYSFVADHFQYLASIPIFALFAAGVILALQRLKVPALVFVAVCLMITAPLAALTWRQSANYVSAETLYRATIASNPGAWLAHNNLGLILASDGRVAEARAEFEEALRLDPDVPEHHMNLGRLLVADGELQEGAAHLTEAIRLDPLNADAFSNLGVALLREGRVPEAVTQFENAVRIQPNHPEALANLSAAHQAMGVELAGSGHMNEAVVQFEQAAGYNPYDAGIQYNLGTALLALGHARDAIAHLEAALSLKPDFAEAQANLARAQAARH